MNCKHVLWWVKLIMSRVDVKWRDDRGGYIEVVKSSAD